MLLSLMLNLKLLKLLNITFISAEERESVLTNILEQ